MAANNTLTVSELDFEGISSSLVTFLQNYPQFKDYDFEGSNLRTLIDLLSYNTYLNSFYTNMAINEMFLDTALVRDSVISHAKHLNYTPRSYRSSEGKIDITVYPDDNPAYIQMARGTKFNGTDGQQVFSFITNEDQLILPVDGSYTVSNVSIYEGSSVTEIYNVNTSIQDQRFVLSNPTIDTRSLQVQVSNSIGGTETWDLASSLLGLNTNSKVYFLQATGDKYEIVFGDNIVSANPPNGAKITANYRICNGEKPNGIKKYKGAEAIGGYTTYQITPTLSSNGSAISSSGGATAESTKSIRLSAPRAYQTLERAITYDDYKTILFSQFPEIRAINVYGGDQLSPPQYGKVYISLDVKNAVGLSDTESDKIQSFIYTKAPISITPVVVPADYTYAAITTNVSYNLNVSSLGPGDIQNMVLNAITNYNDTSLDDFEVNFRYSKLVAAIDNADPSIFKTETMVKIFKDIVPDISVSYSASLDYQNALIPGTISSTSFTYNGSSASLIDDGNGNLQIATSINNVLTAVAIVGTIDYTSGIINVVGLNISEYVGAGIHVYAETVMHDFSGKKNTIVMIDKNSINVNVTGIRA